MKNLFIGIDVSKNKLDICISNKKNVLENTKIINNKTSILGLLDYLQSSYKKQLFYFGYEATSTYMNTLKEVLHEKNQKQIMINPYQMSHYLKHLNMREKTDIKDAVGIAKYIQSLNESDFVTIHSEDKNLFNKFNTLVNLLSKMTTQIKNFEKAQKEIKHGEIDLLVDKLKLQLLELQDKVRGVSIEIMYRLYPQTKQIREEVKGVGDKLLLQLVPVFLTSTNYTLKQIQSYVGLSPAQFQSGSSVHKREKMSKRGNSLVRKQLYMSTMNAIRFNPIIKEKYNRLKEKGKPNMVALVACMSHLLRAIFIKFNQYATIPSK